MSEYESNFGYEDDITGTPLEVSVDDISTVARHFNGDADDGNPKASGTYSLYDFNAPDDDPSKEAVFGMVEPRYSFGFDKATGFYQLDAEFPSCDSEELRLFWGRLQKHRYCIDNEPDKMYIFFLQLVAMSSPDEIVTANIINPLAFFLTRKAPVERVWESNTGTDVLYGGNIVRMLVHPKCVEFETTPMPEEEELYDYDEDQEAWNDDTESESFN